MITQPQWYEKNNQSQQCKMNSLRDINSFTTIKAAKQEVGGSAEGQANYCKSIGVILQRPALFEASDVKAQGHLLWS